MISIYIPPTTPTKVATTTRTVAISQHIAPKNDLSFSCPLLTHPGPDSSVTSPSPSVEPPEPAPSKKRKRDPNEQPPNPRAPPKTPRKKRAPSGAPRGKRVQHLREESAPLPDNAVRNRSRTRERCTGPNRMGALESTIPVERWWREAQPVERTTQESSDAAHACSGQPTIGTEAPARKQIQSIDVVRPKWKGYRAWFRNPHNPDDPFWKFGPDNIPSAELEYPADNSTELYALVDALDHDDYQPLKDLFLTIDTIAGNYMDDADRTHIGYPNPITTLENDSSSQASPPSLYAHPHSPGRANRASSPTPMEPADSELPVYKRLVKARDTRDGPQFLQALATLNGYIRALRPNMQQHLRTKWTGIPPPVWKRVCDEGYQRGVGPRMRELVKYKQWTSGVYGELMQPFISEVIHRCGLGPGKVFVDLGSGVAHTLMQASLQSGCTSYGVELSPPAASIAKDHEREFNNRLEMWDLCCSEFKHIEGDMLESKEVLEWICKADVILVNNFVFEELLNERLTCLFLDARDGTQIVSLKCFLDRGFKITERTISSPQAILRVEERDWIAGAVSWSNTTGTYYVHTVDRSNLQAEEERLNAARSRPSRRRQVH